MNDVEVIPNPLASLVSQMGLSHIELAERAKLPLEQVKAALAREPEAPFHVAIALMNLLRVTMQVQAIKRFRFWIRQETIDELLFDNVWRDAHGLLHAAKTAPELKQVVLGLAGERESGSSWLDLAKRLNTDLVPGFNGTLDWHRQVVHRLVLRETARDEQGVQEVQSWASTWIIKPDAPCLEAWRKYAISSILSDLCPDDPFASVRYEFEVATANEKGGLFKFRSKGPVPIAVAGWMEQSLNKMPGIADRWGKLVDKPRVEPAAGAS